VTAGKMAKAQTLKIGDRVRVVRLPPVWSTPGWHVPRSTREIYRLMISRRRPVRIYEVDFTGAWVHLQVRTKRGRLEHHDLTLDDGCWVKVRRHLHD